MKNKNIDVLFRKKDLLPKGQLTNHSESGDAIKYYAYPQDIIYAHLRNYGIKFVGNNQL